MVKITVTTNSPPAVVVGKKDTVKVDIPGGGNVTIVANPNEVVNKVKIEFRDDDQVDSVTIDLSTFSGDNLHIDIKHYDPNDQIALIGAFNMVIDPTQPDHYTFDYIGSDGEVHSGFLHAKDRDEKDFTLNPIEIVCFGKGTLLETASGLTAIETLVVGDLVKTCSNGFQTIRWIGSRQLDSLALARNPLLRPFLIKKDAFGTNKPFQTLTLSPNHRVLLTDWRAELLFGQSEVLAAVKHLENDHSILQQNACQGVTYFHILFDQHQTVMSNGLETESLYPGQVAMGALDDDDAEEMLALFPEFAMTLKGYGDTSHTVLKSFEVQALKTLTH